jgi:hypothetical protein
MPRLVFEHSILRGAGPLPLLAPGFFNPCPLSSAGSALLLLDLVQKELPGSKPVLGLGAFIFAPHFQAGWPVREHDCGGSFIDVLTSSPARTCENLLYILLANSQGGHSLQKPVAVRTWHKPVARLRREHIGSKKAPCAAHFSYRGRSAMNSKTCRWYGLNSGSGMPLGGTAGEP